jgi:hypothetical protein
MYQDLVLDLLEDPEVPSPLVKNMEHSILKMAGFASSAVSSLPGFASAVMPSLRPGTPPDVLSALLSALFGWDLKEKLISMIVQWISSSLEGDDEGEDSRDEDCQPTATESALFGLSLLDIILSEVPLRSSLLSSAECVTSLIEALHPFMNVLEARLAEGCEEARISDHVMLMASEIYYRLLLHVAACSKEPVCPI